MGMKWLLIVSMLMFASLADARFGRKNRGGKPGKKKPEKNLFDQFATLCDMENQGKVVIDDFIYLESYRAIMENCPNSLGRKRQLFRTSVGIEFVGGFCEKVKNDEKTQLPGVVEPCTNFLEIENGN